MAAGLPYSTFQSWREEDSEVELAVRAAYDEGTQRVIVKELKRRGIDGWDEPVYQGGKRVGKVRKYSDTLLLALVRSRDATFSPRGVAVELPQPPDGDSPTGAPGLIPVVRIEVIPSGGKAP